MAYLSDRVRDTTTTTGTGSITLSGTAPSGFQTFATALGSVSIVTAYCIEGGAEWEVGEGTFNGTTTLTRDQVFSSSNANALVNFSAGTKNVFVTQPAKYNDPSGLSLALAMGAYSI